MIVSGVATHIAYNDKLPIQKRTLPEQDSNEEEIQKCTVRFLETCERNKVVSSRQQQERYQTFGGGATLDPYVAAFNKYIK